MYKALLYSISDQNFRYEITFLDLSIIKTLFRKINQKEKIININSKFIILIESDQEIIFLKCKDCYCKIFTEDGNKKLFFPEISIIQKGENYVLSFGSIKFVNY